MPYAWPIAPTRLCRNCIITAVLSSAALLTWADREAHRAHLATDAHIHPSRIDQPGRRAA